MKQCWWNCPSVAEEPKVTMTLTDIQSDELANQYLWVKEMRNTNRKIQAR